MEETIGLGQGLIISLASMAIVFLALILIASCITIMTKLVGSDSSIGEDKKIIKDSSTMESKDKDEFELIAVISAAIACKLGLKIADVKINSIKNRTC